MATDQGYLKMMREDFGKLIDEQLDLSNLQKEFMHKRWLDQLLWMESTAGKAQKKYYYLRIATIIGGVITPVLIAQTTQDNDFQLYAILLGLVVAASAAIEQFFDFGGRWRQYRRTAELLKSEGWKFFQLSDHYQNFEDHAEAYSTFTSRVEAYIQQDVDTFINVTTKEKKPKDQSKKPENTPKKDR